MRVRIAGIPAPYTLATDILVVDETENYYIVDGDDARIIPLGRPELLSIMGFFDPVQSPRWHTIDTVARAIHRADSHADRNQAVAVAHISDPSAFGLAD